MAEGLLLKQTEMKGNSIHILSTRPVSEAIINKASQHNIIIDTFSFIETRTVIDEAIGKRIKELSGQRVSVVFTSMNGAEAVIETLKTGELHPAWKVYCIGAATQTIIKGYFTKASIKGRGKNAVELAEAIIKDGIKEVVFFCGNQRRDELPQHLQKHGVSVHEVVVYETIETSVRVEKDYNGIMFFSPSGVRSFFASNKIDEDTVLFAIGNTTADEIKSFSTNKIVIGDDPAKDKLAEVAIEHFNPVKQH